MDYLSGLCFVNFLTVVFGIPDSTQRYSVNLDNHTFHEAEKLCGRDGFLANIPDQEAIVKILKLIEHKGDRKSTLFWIGLKKEKEQCVQENLPLKGFYWTIDNSTEYALNKWKEEASGTCTNALCGLLSVEYGGSTIDSWGLTAKSCSKPFPYICKHKGVNEITACPSRPNILGHYDIMQKENDPYTLKISCSGTDSYTLTCSRDTGQWKLVGGTETDIDKLCLACENVYKNNRDGKCKNVDECQQSNNCKFHCFNTEGSYTCMCADEMKKIYSQLCKKSNTTLFRSTTDATNHVQEKTTSSFMDKKPLPSSQPAVDNTTESGVTIDESTGDLPNIIIPLIIALLIFVVLVVIIVAIVKFFLIRRARKRAKKRAALKESVALNGADSMEKVNE